MDPRVRKFTPRIWEILEISPRLGNLKFARFVTGKSVKITVFKLKPGFQNFSVFYPQKISEKSTGTVKDENPNISELSVLECLRIRKFPRFTPGFGNLAPGFGKYPKYISRFRRDWEI
jgi:hypothetical protein